MSLQTVTGDQLTQRQALGVGGFGRVVRAWYRPWGMEVALKVLHGTSDGCASDKEILREAGLMSSLRFPHVVSLVGLYRHPGEPLGIVMEFLEFGSLASLQEKLTLPTALRVRLVHEVALGMNYLHGLDPPLLHLDLNPRNVLLDGELHAKIADFGLSKLKQMSSLEGSGSVGGTLEYLPPECFDLDKDGYKPGPPTDVYSFGIMVWSILTGKHPYRAQNNRILIKVLIPQNQRPDLRELPKDNEGERLGVLKELMTCCWHNEFRQRPAFKDILVVTDEVFRAHRMGIPDAVHRVLSNLNRQPTCSPSAETSSVGTSLPSSRIADPIGSLCSKEFLSSDAQGLGPPSPRPDAAVSVGGAPPGRARGHRPERTQDTQPRSALPTDPPAGEGATMCPVSEPQGRTAAAPTADQGRNPPPLSTPGTRQECHKGSQKASAQRKLPKWTGWSVGNVSVLASSVEGMQIGSGNTMHIVRTSRRK